ncbi:2500_t:CDS:2 [Racocetra persica]|uniref:2500_t:CDS:1 n=1 Tax=Racocetra persica TaxID=160502 RepID=A0ACA9S727_9GLOM|nr:2500_t:CDS:2 [Racocetra persica]
MNENINQLKSFSDSDICRNEEKGNLHLASQKTEMVKKTSLEREKGNEGGPKIIHKTQTITGTLTSRIETRQDYHYGFFSVPNQEQDIPTYTINETKEKAAHSASNIYQKLHCLQSQTDQISKKELNKFGNYKYFTEQQALKLLKPLLKEQKLTLTFSDIYNYTQPNGGFSSQKHEKE